MKGLKITMKYIGISVWGLLLASIYQKCIGNNAPDAFEYNHHVYTTHYGKYTWSRANMICIHQDGVLIQIEDSVLQQKVSQFLKNQEIEPDGFWIGIFGASKIEDLYPSWHLTGDDPIFFHNWYSLGRHPLNYSSWYTPGIQPEKGDCALMRADDFKWEKYLCHSAQYQFSFICQNSTRKDLSQYAHIKDVTIEGNVTDVIPGLYFEVNVRLSFPFAFSASYCVSMLLDNSRHAKSTVVDISSYSISIGKNIINLKRIDGSFSNSVHEICFINGNVRNRTGDPDDNFVRLSYGFFFRRMCEDNRIMRIPYFYTGMREYSYFPLVFMCSNSNIIMNYTKTAFFEISSPRSDPVSLKKGKILIITIDAYIPYFYPHISAKISGANGNKAGIRPLWIKLDQVGWNYDFFGNGLDNMEVETCLVKNSLILNLPEDMANRGVYLASNKTEKDLVRFRAFVYLADHTRDNIGYPLTVRIYTNKSTTERETLERTIHVLPTNISTDDYIQMVADLPLVSFLDEENENSTTNTMTIMVDTVQHWAFSYYILLFMDTNNSVSDIVLGNVTVSKVGANLICESVNMLLLNTSGMEDYAQRRDLAVLQINVSNVYNVSANESTITLRMMVTANATITHINVTFITPEAYSSLIPNDTSSINVSDESCDNRSYIMKQRTFTLLVFVLVVFLVPDR